MKDFKIELSISPKDFEKTCGWKPDEAEFKEFCTLCEKGLRNEHIDWTMIFNCAKDEMSKPTVYYGYSRNSTKACPVCHRLNHDENTQCWNCKKPLKEVNK